MAADRFCKICGVHVAPKRHYCDACRVVRKKQTNADFWRREAAAKPTLTCASCGEEYPRRCGKQTLRHLCQPCALKQRRINDLERDRARQANGSRKKPETSRAYAKAYKAKNPDWNRKQNAIYRQRHPDKIREWSNNRRARKASSQGEFSMEEFFEKCAMANWKCVYCGDAIDERAVSDHIVPLSRGGSNFIDNIAPCCMPCNSSKGNKLLSEWRGRRVVA